MIINFCFNIKQSADITGKVMFYIYWYQPDITYYKVLKPFETLDNERHIHRDSRSNYFDNARSHVEKVIKRYSYPWISSLH